MDVRPLNNHAAKQYCSSAGCCSQRREHEQGKFVHAAIRPSNRRLAEIDASNCRSISITALHGWQWHLERAHSPSSSSFNSEIDKITPRASTSTVNESLAGHTPSRPT
jgi:hypothetical protein